MILNCAIVDDDKIFQFLMDVLIKGSGISAAPVWLKEGKDFLEWWQEQKLKPEATLVFLDINMPVMDGWQVLDSLVEDSAENIFVVIITSSIIPQDKERALGYPMVIDFLVKPIVNQNLSDLKNHPKIQQFFNPSLT